MKQTFYVSVTSTYKVTEDSEGDAIKECMRKRNPPEPIARQANVCLDTSKVGEAAMGTPAPEPEKPTVVNNIVDKDTMAIHNAALHEGKVIMARWFLGELEAAGAHGTASTFKMTLENQGFTAKELKPKLISSTPLSLAGEYDADQPATTILVVSYKQLEHLGDWATKVSMMKQPPCDVDLLNGIKRKINDEMGVQQMAMVGGLAVLPVTGPNFDKWKPDAPYIDLRCLEEG